MEETCVYLGGCCSNPVCKLGLPPLCDGCGSFQEAEQKQPTPKSDRHAWETAARFAADGCKHRNAKTRRCYAQGTCEIDKATIGACSMGVYPAFGK
jgi:hypothetical protein